MQKQTLEDTFTKFFTGKTLSDQAFQSYQAFNMQIYAHLQYVATQTKINSECDINRQLQPD